MKGLITFEGCEGVGKSTQLRMLGNFCREKGIDAVFTREPGGSRVAESIRRIILDARNSAMSNECEALLYAAARNQHIYDIIKPALEKGRLVFCDRYIDSTFAYQGIARGLGAETADRLNKMAVGDFYPELTIFLDLDPVSSFARKGGPNKRDRLEIQGREFFRKVYEGYIIAAKRAPERIVRLDASGNTEETHALVVDLLRKKGIIDV